MIGNQSQFGIFLFDSGIEDIEALVVLIAPVFIANLNILQWEGGGMSLLGTLSTPLGSDVADGIFYSIHTVVQIISNLILRRSISHAVLATQPDIADKHRLCTYILTEL